MCYLFDRPTYHLTSLQARVVILECLPFFRDFLDGESDIELVYSHDGVKGEVQRVTVKESDVGGGGGKKDRGRKKDKDKDGSGGRDGKDKKGKGKQGVRQEIRRQWRQGWQRQKMKR